MEKHKIEKIAVVVTLIELTTVGTISPEIHSELFIVNSINEECALGYVMKIEQIKKALQDGYFIVHTNTAIVL